MMKRGVKILLGIVIALVVIGSIATAIIYNTFFKDEIETAFLTVESGELQVDSGSGWRTVTGEVSLSLKDKVQTLDGTAVITLYESILIALEENTEISLSSLQEEKTAIKQEKGSTWSKFTSVTGIKGYEVETPTTVATVRGTEFGINADDDIIWVAEGKVDVNRGGKIFTLEEFEKLLKGKACEKG